MKKTLLLLSSLFCASAFAQSSAQLESKVTYLEGQCLYKNAYAYDEQGNKVSDTLYNWEIGKWVESTKTEYAYDPQGRLTADRKYNWSNGGWSIDTRSEYKYENQEAGGRVTDAVTYKWSNGMWVDHTKYECIYDLDGSESVYTYFSMMGMWFNYTLTVNVYSDGRLIDSELFMNGGDWEPYTKWEYNYDADGRNVSDMGYVWDEDDWAESEKYEYAYDADGRKTADVNYVLSDGAWTGYQKWEFTYDADGNLTQEDYFNGTGSGWYKYGYYLYTYNNLASINSLPFGPAAKAPRKMLKDGQVIITDGISTYGLDGARIR